jgi:hypothetical protein
MKHEFQVALCRTNFMSRYVARISCRAMSHDNGKIASKLLFRENTSLVSAPGFPDSTCKSLFGYILVGLGMENVGIRIV